MRERYVRALCREIRQWEMTSVAKGVVSEDSASKESAAVGPASHDVEKYDIGNDIVNKKSVSIFLGGGTPSVLAPDQICRILETVRERFALREDAEITVECNPGTLTTEKLAALKKAGVNRLSIGLQSADDRELKLLGRIHSRADFEQNFRAAREAGFTNINVDLMSALPGQTLQDWKVTLEYVTELDDPPEHISAYSLIVEEGTPFYERYHLQEQEFPSEEEERVMYHLTRELLAKRGYRQYEISNYAKPGYECIHNIGYWTRRDYIGFGLGAASCVDNIRWNNTRDIQRYLAAFEETEPGVSTLAFDTASRDKKTEIVSHEDIVGLSPRNMKTEKDSNKDIACLSLRDMKNGMDIREDIVSLSLRDQIEETVFLGLRMNEGIDMARFEKEFGAAFHDLFRERITDLEAQGLVETVDGHLRVTEKGMDLEGYVEERLLT